MSIRVEAPIAGRGTREQQPGGWRWSTERKIRVSFGIALTCLGIIGIISYFSVANFREDAARVDHTHEVIDSLRALTLGLVSAQSAQRGYTIGVDQHFLGLFEEAAKETDRALGTLRRLMADNPVQQRRIEALAPLVAQRMDAARAVIERRRTESMEAVQAAPPALQGFTLQDRIVAQLNEMEAAERVLLRERSIRAESSSKVVQRVIVGGSVSALIFVSVALAVIRRDFAGSRRAELQLREAHDTLEVRVQDRTAELQLILDTVPALIFFKDREHRLLRVNLALAQTLGKTRESMEGKTDAELGAVPANAEHYYRDDLEVMTSGRAKLGIIEQLDTPGGPRWMQTDKLPYRNATGEMVGIIGFAVDITERKVAEERVAWLASFPERNPNPIIEVHAVTGLIRYLNPAAARQFPDLQDQGMRHPLLADLPAMAKDRLPATETTVRRELRIGESYFAQAATFLPEPQCYRVYCTDITDRKRMEDALVRESQLLRTVIDHLPDYIYVKDPDTRFLMMNAAGLRLMELDGIEQVLGRTVFDFFPAEQANAFVEDDRRVLETGQSVLDREEPITGHDGEKRFLLTTKVPLRDAKGQIVGLVGISRDITERRRAEMASSRLAAIVESSGDAIIGKDLDGIVTSWNRGAEIIFGFAPGEMVGSSIMRLIPADRQDEEVHIMGKIRRGESIEHFETVRQTRGGNLIDVSIAVSPIRDANGKVLGVSKVARDITRRKRAEEAQRASEVRYRTLFDYAPDGIVIADQQSYYLDANASICRMLGYARDEFIGLHASDIVAQTEVQHIGTALRVLKARSDYQREWQFRRKDGSVFPAEVIGTMMPDGNLMGMIRDISGRKEAERQLRESDERLLLAIDAAQMGTWMRDFRNNTLIWSEGQERLNEFGPGTFPGTYEAFVGLVHPDDRTSLLAAQELALRAGGRYRAELRFQLPSGRLRWGLILGQIIYDPQGQPERMLGVEMDITERKLADGKIRQLNEDLEQRVMERTAQLEAANKELEAFSYSVSHDLRAPLRAVDGFSKAVLEDYSPLLPEAGRRYLKTIRDGAQRMGQLIDDLLTFSQTSRQALIRQEVHMDRLVRDALSELSHQQEGREIKITVGDLPTCHGDRALLKQVWINLLSNALKYTRQRNPAVVEIGCVRQDGKINYFVRDNGAGFDMRYAGKLFGVFQRLHRADEFAGTGVGLAIAQRVVHRHGGRIWAEAEVDRGATFYFTLEGSLE